MATPNSVAMTPDYSPSGPVGRGERPTGVTILAVLDFIGAALLVLAGLAFFALGAAIGSMFGAEGAGLGAAIGGFLGIFMIGGALLIAVLGYGLWIGAAWGWVLTLVLSGINVLSGLFALVQGEFSSVLGLAVSGFIIWYLLQPGVKRWFGKA